MATFTALNPIYTQIEAPDGRGHEQGRDTTANVRRTRHNGWMVSHSPHVLPDSLRLGPARLTVADRVTSRDWYVKHLGLHVVSEDGKTTALGDETDPVLILEEDPHARRPAGEAGLFHVALLYPSRSELAFAARRLAENQTPIQGLSDHRTHEAIYLADSEGNGLELAADRPREQWPPDLGYQSGPAPLDVPALLAAAPTDTPPPRVGNGLRVGHVHLHVGDIERAQTFYRDVLGLHETANLGTAAFFAAGDYHHHCATNVWRGRDIPPQPPHVVGLASWSFHLDGQEVDAVAARLSSAGARVEEVPDGLKTWDPWDIPLVVLAA